MVESGRRFPFHQAGTIEFVGTMQGASGWLARTGQEIFYLSAELHQFDRGEIGFSLRHSVPDESPASMAVLTTREQFLDLLKRSHLIEPVRLEEWLDAHPALPGRSPDLANLLVQDGFLTDFQARQLMMGKHKGFLVNSKYKLLEQVGKGGMGTVYMCEHILMRRIVALKALPLDENETPAIVERFYREARAASALNHPNIVRAFDVDRTRRALFLAMEYVDGTNLYQIVQKFGPLSITRAVNYIVQAATGLQHAYESGWVHRDIKPANILLNRQGTAQILDMGLARLFTDKNDVLTAKYNDKSILGTADYISPEQAMNSKEVDIRTDVYSLGATLYFLLAGHPPFPGGSVARKLIAHQTRSVTPLQQHRGDIPPVLEATVMRLMAKNAADRPATPADAIQCLLPWYVEKIEPPPDAEMPQYVPAIRSYLQANPNAITRSLGVMTAAPRTKPNSSSVIMVAADLTAPPPALALEDTPPNLRAPTSNSSGASVMLFELPPRATVAANSGAGSGGSSKALIAAVAFLLLLCGLGVGWRFFGAALLAGKASSTKSEGSLQPRPTSSQAGWQPGLITFSVQDATVRNAVVPSNLSKLPPGHFTLRIRAPWQRC